MGEDRLVLVQIVAAGVNDALAVDHEDVLDLRTDADQQLHAGRRSSLGTKTDDLRRLDVLAGDFRRIEHTGGGNDGRAMLVVVKHWDIALLDERTLDLEAFRCLDVLQVDATKRNGDTLDGINE